MMIGVDTVTDQFAGLQSNGDDYLRPPKLAGTTMARTVLSALADTRREAEGLNLRAVGGNEWA